MNSDTYRAFISPISSYADVQEIKAAWSDLEKKCDATFFNSWTWVGSWIETFHDSLELHFFSCEREGSLIGVGLLVGLSKSTGGRFAGKRFGLNDVPRVPIPLNMCVEYNSLLVLPDDEAQVWELFLGKLSSLGPNWQEVIVRSAPQRIAELLQNKFPGSYILFEEQDRSWSRNLEFSESFEVILNGLSPNKRNQLKRAIKKYGEKFGPLEYEEAKEVSIAVKLFEEMGELHTAYWESKNRSGSFKNPNWVKFHKNVIKNGFSDGSILLLKVSAGEKVLGYVYGFLWQRCFYMLQTGFVATRENWEKPGYLSHLIAMMVSARKGAVVYDFLRGDEEYKRSLSNQAKSVFDILVRRASLRNRVNDFLRIGARTLQSLLRRLGFR